MLDTSITIEQLNKYARAGVVQTLNITYTDINKDSLSAKMPVDNSTIQPVGILHGGSSGVLAESLGSVASFLSIDRNNFFSVGLELKCNHLKMVTSGFVTGIAKPKHLGRSTHLWEIEILNDAQQLVCFATLTMQIIAFSVSPKSKQMLLSSPLGALI